MEKFLEPIVIMLEPFVCGMSTYLIKIGPYHSSFPQGLAGGGEGREERGGEGRRYRCSIECEHCERHHQ